MFVGHLSLMPFHDGATNTMILSLIPCMLRGVHYDAVSLLCSRHYASINDYQFLKTTRLVIVTIFILFYSEKDLCFHRSKDTQQYHLMIDARPSQRQQGPWATHPVHMCTPLTREQGQVKNQRRHSHIHSSSANPNPCSSSKSSSPNPSA